MKKVLYIDTESQKNKYVLKKEYGGFGIYQNMTPSGYLVHKSWAIANGDKILVINSFNNRCLYEILSLIDNYNESGLFGIKGFDRNVLVAHPNGNKDL